MRISFSINIEDFEREILFRLITFRNSFSERQYDVVIIFSIKMSKLSEHSSLNFRKEGEEKPQMSRRRRNEQFLFPFVETYVCESRFSTLTNTKRR